MHPAFQPIVDVTGPLQFEHTALSKAFVKRELKRNEAWLMEGQRCKKLCFVESGLLRHARETSEGSLTRWASLPGQYALNFPSFTQSTPSEDSIVAAVPTCIYELGRDTWLEWRLQYPQLQQFWVATLEYLLTCFEDRVVSLITGSAADRYQYMMDRYPEFLLHLPQHYVADLLGIAPRHLSRIRGEKASG